MELCFETVRLLGNWSFLILLFRFLRWNWSSAYFRTNYSPLVRQDPPSSLLYPVLHESWDFCNLLVGTDYSLPLVLTRHCYFYSYQMVLSSELSSFLTGMHWSVLRWMHQGDSRWISTLLSLCNCSAPPASFLQLPSGNFLKAVSCAVTGPILFVTRVWGITVLHCLMSIILKTFVSFFPLLFWFQVGE